MLVPRLDVLGDVGGQDKALVLVGWRRYDAQMDFFRGSAIQVNTRLLGAFPDQRWCRKARADIALTPRQSRMFEPNDLSPAVAREEDALPQRRLHREYEPTRHDTIVPVICSLLTLHGTYRCPAPPSRGPRSDLRLLEEANAPSGFLHPPILHSYAAIGSLGDFMAMRDDHHRQPALLSELVQ